MDVANIVLCLPSAVEVHNKPGRLQWFTERFSNCHNIE